MKKSKPSSSSPCELSSLPDESVLSCLARVSRLDYPSLSLVSKKLRSLILSPELYNVRTLMGFTENCIFLCLLIPPDPNPRWFTFSHKTLKHPHGLVPIRSNSYQPPEASSVVALGYGIYVIGGRINGRGSSSVSFLDCRTHTWSVLPSMGVARYSAAAGVVDGKIYVLGGCEDRKSTKWGEVFDPKTKTWDALPMPTDQNVLGFPVMYESAVIEEKVFGLNGTGTSLFYIPSEGIWKLGNTEVCGDRRSWHVIENVMYCSVTGGKVLWCEVSELDWRELKGLEDLNEILCCSTLVNYDGGYLDGWEDLKKMRPEFWNYELDDLFPGHKISNSGSNMLLFWDLQLLDPERLEIWCAEISLDKRKEKGEIWGNIEWLEVIMTLNPPPKNQQHCKILHSLSLNL